MKDQAFRSWLNDIYRTSSGKTMDPSVIATRLANCRRVERFEGDLDEHAAGNRGVLLSRLTLATDDGAPLHSIPIDGNAYTGTATLKTAVNLYFKFVDWKPAIVQAVSHQPAPHPTISTKAGPPIVGTWPMWSQPSEQEELALARVVCRYVRFLSPAIVDAVVSDNEKRRDGWISGLMRRGIDPNAYLWPRSACAFPGVRRHAG